MKENMNNKKIEKTLIKTMALAWGISQSAAQNCFYMFKNQKTK